MWEIHTAEQALHPALLRAVHYHIVKIKLHLGKIDSQAQTDCVNSFGSFICFFKTILERR